MAQLGETYHSSKQFKGYGSGIYEIVSNYDTNAYRSIYTVQLKEFVYVIHAFQKKSKSGIKTSKEELGVIIERLKCLKSIHKEGIKNDSQRTSRF